MTTALRTPPLDAMIAQLHSDSAASKQDFLRRLGELPPEEVRAWRENPQDYRALYAEAKDVHLAVSPRTATLLYVLARAQRARRIVEFGTSFGVSTLHLAAALKDNGGGRLISTEFEPGKVARARRNLEEAGLSELVEIREGDAVQTLAHDVPGPVDLVFLDGAGTLYLELTRLLGERLAPGALIVADNADGAPDYLAHVRSTGRYISTRLHDDVEVSLRTSG